MHEELDLKILKSITTDKVNALSFSYKYDKSIFDSNSQEFAKLVIEYIQHFKSTPTRRTLIDRHKANEKLVELISESFDELEAIEYDIKEFPYDLVQFKKRYQQAAVERIREQTGDEDPDNPENPEEFFNKLSLEISRVTSLDLERTYTQKPVGDYVDEFIESYESYKLNPEAFQEIQTKYSMIDTATGGVVAGDLIMIGGETAAGKSQLLNNLGKQIWMQDNTLDTVDFNKGYNVLYFSLEMPYRNCFMRFLSSLANVPQRSLAKSTLTEEEDIRVKKAYNFIKRYQEAGYYFDIVDTPRNLTIEEVELRYNDAMLRYRPDIVIVDYMGLMHNPAMAREQDWLKMGAIACSLHEFGRAYDCVVITAAQLTDIKRGSGSGNASEESKRVGVHRWGRSSLIMHNVNLGIQIETRPNEEIFPDMKIHIVKNRNGPLAKGSLIKNFANSSLVDVPFNTNEIPGDVSSNIPNLIKQIQDAKNKPKE
jgi:replicative DNA helicase